ncbi:ureidoglycolate hydrolase [Mangifera indica]|uniref:ureidoglycolate hydrolase n=1 Tax=Mangifera indica TaxID=29780 RepID=UPI001CFB40FC|nr:ureidoglycolate hydrolase [Mangifera indica]
MSLRFHHSLLLLQLIFCSISTISSQENGDPTIRTMEAFSGYPFHESNSFATDFVSSLSVDTPTLQKQIDELSTFSDTPAPSVTRILYSEKDVLARRYIKNLMTLAGLSVREDTVGNIFGRWTGYEAELAPVATGSHIDAIPYSGKYDGVVGVLGAIEAINVLKRSGFKPRRSLEVIMFTSEEPTRFGISCLGSRLLARSEALAKDLLSTVDSQNISFLDAARSAGYAKEQEDLSSVFLQKGSYSAFLELHIEQGPILEEEGTSIGIVTAIAAPASLKVDFEGNGGHAGAVLMPKRNDAGLAAAELALAVEKHVLDSGSIDTVGTVGILELHPGAINSIPSKSHLEIDTRDIDEKRRNIVVEKIHQSAVSIAKTRSVVLSEFKIINQDPPALSEKLIIEAAEAASKELKLTHKLMISRAYHDSLFMARVSPMGMIFIPCYKGYSHKPEEYAAGQDIGNGVKVLALTLAKLSVQ